MQLKFNFLFGGLFLLASQLAFADNVYSNGGIEYEQEQLVFANEKEKRDIVGSWLDINDAGRVSARIEIYERNGKVYGKSAEIVDLENRLRVCSKCKDERKGQYALGMEIIKDLKKVEDDWDWKGGKILDPSNGNIYKMRAWTSDDGKKLNMRGYLGPFYQTRVWLRTQKKLDPKYATITEEDKLAFQKLNKK